MQHATHGLIGQRSVKLVYAAWLPDAAPRAVAVVVHGIFEHMGRYAHVVEALSAGGYAVYAVDHRGHGQSAGVRGHVERFDFLVEDLHLLVRKAHEDHPGLPVFMIGHSMGGLIAIRYALAYGHEIEGLVVSGPALQIGDDVSPLLKRVSGVLSAVVPRLPILPLSTGPESVLSRDPEVEARIAADPLHYRGKIRARLGYEMMRASVDARARMGNLTLPLLIMHGAEDKLTNPQGSIALHEQARSADKTLKLWPGLRHEIFNEPEQAEVIGYLREWLDRHA